MEGYTRGELELIIRRERAALVRERRDVAQRMARDQRRVKEIDDRLDNLEKAENLLEEGEVWRSGGGHLRPQR